MTPVSQRNRRRPKKDHRVNDRASPFARPSPSGIASNTTRPKVVAEPAAPMGALEVKQLYSTSAGSADMKPFSTLDRVIDPGLLEGIKKMGFEFMTPVQQKVLTELPSISSDCIVQAKTGTGKTLAFLLPAIQSILAGNAPRLGKVGVLVICPTRELALQIAKECKDLIACLPQRLECHTAFGGTARASSLKAFMDRKPTILVATPGRLDDILGEEVVRERFTDIKTVVLDEADQMLDAGFAPAIKKILRQIRPKSDGWQGMCFSATLPSDVLDVANIVLYPGYTHLSTLDPNEVPTHERVPQYYVTVPSISQIFTGLSAVIQEEYSRNPTDFKVIVFGTTANGVGLLYDLYKHALPQFRVFELQSRMSQAARTKTTQDFKNTKSGVLFASDVVGRGLDFPNVGLVIQLGLPSSKDQYVHRVGRTARAGKEGRAVIILFSREAFFPNINKMLPIEPYPTSIPSILPKYEDDIRRAFVHVDEATKQKAYQAFLGYNKTFTKKLQLSQEGLVELANEYAETMGCPEPPMLDKRVVGKMGLKGVRGLRVGDLRDAA